MVFVIVTLHRNHLMLLTILFAIIAPLLFVTFSDNSLKHRKRNVDESYSNDKIVRRQLNPNNSVTEKSNIEKSTIKAAESKVKSNTKGVKTKETAKIAKTSSNTRKETTNIAKKDG